jgi:hypothetical protein
VTLSKSATDIPEILYESLSQAAVHISRPVECQLKMMTVQGYRAPAKQQEMLKKSESSSMKTVTEQSKGSQTLLGLVCPEES